MLNSTLACIIRPFGGNNFPFGEKCGGSFISEENMAATATLMLGEPIGCTTTDTEPLETDNRLQNDTEQTQNTIWVCNMTNSPRNTATTPPNLVKNRPSVNQRYKLINEGDILICRLNHTRTIVSKIMNSKYLRRWESHRIILGQNDISSTMVSVKQYTKGCQQNWVSVVCCYCLISRSIHC